MLSNLSIYINYIAEQIRKIEEKIINEADIAIDSIKNIQNMKKNITSIT